MNYLFDYGEFLICIAPIFLVIAAITLALVWNNLPSYEEKRKENGENQSTGK